MQTSTHIAVSPISLAVSARVSQGERLIQSGDKVEGEVEEKVGKEDAMMDTEVDVDADFQADRPARRPKTPSKREVEEHELTHVPPREWCVYCAQARSQDNARRKQDREEQEDEEKEAAVSTFAFDYVYFKRKPEHRGIDTL